MAVRTAFRHKHVRVDQRKVDEARRVLEAETLDRALAVVASEARVDSALRRLGGKGRLKKAFA